MEISGWRGGLYRLLDWITRLAYVNILWLLFTIMGAVLFGLAPATNAMFSVMRKWMTTEEDVSVFKTFWKSYRTEFIRANGLIFFMVVIGLFLYLDLRFFQASDWFAFQLLAFVVLGLILAYIITFLFLFPIFVHFDLKFHQYLWYALLIGVSHPIHAMFMVIGTLIVYVFFLFLPGMFFFFGGSLVCFMIMWLTNLVFTKIGDRKEKLQREGSIFKRG